MRLYGIIGSVVILATLMASVGFSGWTATGDNLVANGDFSQMSNFSTYWYNSDTHFSAPLFYSSADMRYYFNVTMANGDISWLSFYQTQSIPDGNYTLTLEYLPDNMDYEMVVDWSRTTVANAGKITSSCGEGHLVFNSTDIRKFPSLNALQDAVVADIGSGWKRLTYNFTASSCSINSDSFILYSNPYTNIGNFSFLVRNYSIADRYNGSEMFADAGIESAYQDASDWFYYIDATGSSHVVDGAFYMNWSSARGDFGLIYQEPAINPSANMILSFDFKASDYRYMHLTSGSYELDVNGSGYTINSDDLFVPDTVTITDLGSGWYRFTAVVSNESLYSFGEFSFYAIDVDETFSYYVDNAYLAEATYTPEPALPCEGWECASTARAVVGMSPVVVGLGLIAGLVSMFLMRDEEDSMIALVMKGGVIALISVVMLSILVSIIG